MDTFKIKKNDTYPAISVTLQDYDENAIDLSDSAVWFIMSTSTFEPYTSGTCVITGSTTGQCEYRWDGTNDTGSVGDYWGEFEMVWTGSRMTLPQDHALKIQVYEDYN